jgi:hypothetical protein
MNTAKTETAALTSGAAPGDNFQWTYLHSEIILVLTYASRGPTWAQLLSRIRHPAERIEVRRALENLTCHSYVVEFVGFGAAERYALTAKGWNVTDGTPDGRQVIGRYWSDLAEAHAAAIAEPGSETDRARATPNGRYERAAAGG